MHFGNIKWKKLGFKGGVSIKKQKIELGASLGVGFQIEITWEDINDVEDECEINK